MKKVVVGVLALVGAFTLFAILCAAAIGILSLLAQEGVPSRAVLEIDFDQGVIESVPHDPLAQLMLDDLLEVREVVDALDRAAEDSRIKAVVARIGGQGMGLAHIQEIRDAVARFRESGKPAIAYAESFGEFQSGNGAYYLATAFDEVHLQPSGMLGLNGLLYEAPFFRSTLDKLDIVPQIEQRREYKNAANVYNETEFTAAHREAMTAIMTSHFDQIVRGIAGARERTEAEVRAAFDRGPLLPDEALALGLVDSLAYRDEIWDRVLADAGDDAEMLHVSTYLERAGRPHRRGETIALIFCNGAITTGEDQFSPLDGTIVAGSDSVTDAFRDAIDDDRVKAIVFRVDSPGGSPVASDAIRRETVRAREAGKPVVVSMSNLAGSGGYMVAMSADKIVAEPGTITGSIGVLGGKLVVRGLWSKLGVTFDHVQTSEHGTMWSSLHTYDEGERDRLDDILDWIYDDFVQGVAEGRGLPVERVAEIARGRIWTGEAAKELGLVDELGGLDTALRVAREQMGLDADADVRIKRFPEPMSPLEMLLGQGSRRTAAAIALRRALETVQPGVRTLREATSTPEPGRIQVPESVLRP
jgi:protease-4